MKTMIRFLLLIGLAFFSCGKEQPVEPPAPKAVQSSDQRIYFQYESGGISFSMHHSGILIDSAGVVYRYRQPQFWRFADADGKIVNQAMNLNVLRTDTICHIINRAELAAKIALIPRAAQGAITPPVKEFFDVGTLESVCFTFDENTKVYTKVLLDMKGNYRSENLSPDAQELNQWLLQILSIVTDCY